MDGLTFSFLMVGVFILCVGLFVYIEDRMGKSKGKHGHIAK